MTFRISTATANDLEQIIAQDGAAFGVDHDQHATAEAQSILDLDRFLVVREQGRLVGVAGDYDMQVTVPGGAQVRVPGVTWVSVSVTDRRRGVLSLLMDAQLQGYQARGDLFAMLTASEGGIYRRFGYGPASRLRKTVIDRGLTRLAGLAGDVEPGSVSLMDDRTARSTLPGIHARWQPTRAAAIRRTDARWDVLLSDPASRRGGLSERRHLVHSDGYVSYPLKPDWADGRPAHTCVITDYVVLTGQAHAALWHTLLGMDLVGTIESTNIPLDDPIGLTVTNPREVRTVSLSDGVWVRPVDVAGCLAARSYACEFDATLEVQHRRADSAADGRFRVIGGPDGVEVRRTDRPADIRLDLDAFGSVYLGGERMLALAAAGRVQAADGGLLALVDRAFLADREPVHGTPF